MSTNPVFDIDKTEDQQPQEGAVEVAEKPTKESIEYKEKLSDIKELTKNFTGDQNILLAKYIRKDKMKMEDAIKKVLSPDKKKKVAEKKKAPVLKVDLNAEEKNLYLGRLISKGYKMAEAVVKVYGSGSPEHKDYLKKKKEFDESEEGKADAKKIADLKAKEEADAKAKAMADIEAAKKILEKK